MESTTVWIRNGVPSALYSMVTWLLASGRSRASLPVLRRSACVATRRWAISIGSGISVGVSSQAKPNISPWSPAPPVSTPCAMFGL